MGYKGLQGVTRGYKGLQLVTMGYKRVIGISSSPDSSHFVRHHADD